MLDKFTEYQCYEDIKVDETLQNRVNNVTESTDNVTESTDNFTESTNNFKSPPRLPEKDEPSILIAKLLEEMQQIRKENRGLQSSLEREKKERRELENEKNSLTAEIEELTKTLFEEANGMVAVEAQARWTLEQSQKRLESELSKALELLDLETEQTKLLRGIVEEEKALKKSSDPVFWDIDVFAARMTGNYSEDFFPEKCFDSRPRVGTRYWEDLSSCAVESTEFRLFSSFIDECFRLSFKTSAKMSEDTIMTILGTPFMKNCLHSDIEPCLNFPALERTGKTKSLLKKLLPAMLKNTCSIEPLSYSTTGLNSAATDPDSASNESSRASPLSIRSFLSITATPSRSRSSSPIKNQVTSNAINIPRQAAARNILSPALSSNVTSPRSIPLDSFFGTSPASITSIESCPVSPTSLTSSLRCSLCEASNSPVTHRFKISSGSPGSSPSKSNWNFTCKGCRNRLVSVASLFTVLRHLLQGLHTHRPKLDIFFDFMHSKREMFYARCGGEVAVMFYGLSDFEAFSRKIEAE